MALLADKLGKSPATFGPGIGTPTQAGTYQAVWLAYASGYDGKIFPDGRPSLTSADVLTGLRAYADVLRATWIGGDGTGLIPQVASQGVTGPGGVDFLNTLFPASAAGALARCWRSAATSRTTRPSSCH